MEGLGYASVTQDQARRKLYTVTPEGKKALAENKARVDAIFYRFGEPDVARRAGSVVPATMNLSAAVQMRLRRDATPEQVREIVHALDATAKIIERI
jgi:DNA-binding PadR family transcriptional regulator